MLPSIDVEKSSGSVKHNLGQLKLLVRLVFFFELRLISTILDLPKAGF